MRDKRDRDSVGEREGDPCVRGRVREGMSERPSERATEERDGSVCVCLCVCACVRESGTRARVAE